MHLLKLSGRVCAGVVAALGTTVLAGWALDIAALKGVLPGLATVKANTALCFVLSGAALALVSFPPSVIARRIGQGCAGIVLLVALLTLGEQLTGFDFGIDELLVRDPDTPQDLNPGRMALATSLGFMLAAAALIAGPWTRRYPRLGFLARGLSLGVTAIGAVGLLGYALNFELLYGWYAYRTVAPHTAAGFAVLGAGLWFGGQAGAWPRRAVSDDARIARLAGSCLMLAAVATGLAGFAALESQVEGTLAAGLESALGARIAHITSTLELRTTRAAIIATRPDMLKHLRLLAEHPGNGKYRKIIQGVLESFRPHGFSGIGVYRPSGEEVARLGEFIEAPAIEVRVDTEAETSLLWQGGLYLRHRLSLQDALGPLGTVVAEQFLLKTTEALLAGEAFGESTELLLCRAEAQRFRCFPTRLTPRPFIILPGRASGSTLFVERALQEGAGFGTTVDYRAKHVLGAYAPVGASGLVAVLKVDAEQVYAPIGRQFQWTLGLIALLTAGGALLVRVRVRPLAAALETRVRERTAELHAANLHLGESEERLRQINEDLETRVHARTAELTAANQELEAFSYSVSHDLRAPLRHIDGFVGLLERHAEPTLDDKGRRYVKTISEAAKQMGTLIDDLLFFSRIGRAELRRATVPLQRLVDEVRCTLEPEIAGRDIVWAIDVLPEVQGDPQLLRLVFQNLIGNALKYTRPRAEARIEIGARREDTETVWSIRDNGVGFDMRYVERLFGVFQRLHTSAEFEGTGIGLASVKRIVHRHGGRVWAEGAVGEGACFYFSLPDLA